MKNLEKAPNQQPESVARINHRLDKIEDTLEEIRTKIELHNKSQTVAKKPSCNSIL
jgi:hypothetical protein